MKDKDKQPEQPYGEPVSTATHGPAKARPRHYFLRRFVAMVLIFFAVEALIMLLLPDLPAMPRLVHTLLDPALMSIAMLPAVYFLWMRPQVRYAQEKALFEAAKQSEYEMKQMLNGSPVGLYIVQDRRFVFVNDAFQKITGYSSADLLGTNTLEFVPYEHRETVRHNAVQMLKGQRVSPYEYAVIAKDGGRRNR